MVSTRVVAIVAAIILWLSVGSGWILTVSTATPVNVLDLAGSVGAQYGPCQCPPSSAAPETEALLILNPLMVGFNLLGATIVTFSLALVFSFLSLFRWKLTLPAGVLSVASGTSWAAGLQVSKDYLFSQFNQWNAINHAVSQPEFSPSVGPYIAALAGVVYLSCYFLSRDDILEWPKD